ncbi:MAG: TonB-dependent receptor [Campylobacter sp.]|nr:TonB-dependent receptor [Campylobacter sp.]
MKRSLLIACSAALALNAQVFELGQVEVVANKEGSKTSDNNVAVITQEDMQKNEIKRLSEVAESTAGLYVDKKGPRAEQNFYVRGFDARRVPLYIDGIPVYIPYDGNADFGRFTTFDLSRIDISKGSSSVLYGANTMGGAINLITRKPTRELEGNIGYGFETGKSSDTFGNNVDFNIGSKQELFYVQAGGSFMEDQGQQLSNDFDTKVTGNEDGGRRENSVQRDKKFNIRVGFTPNDTDEYVISYINQKGEKEQPYYTGIYKNYNQAKRFWDWPMWDKESIYWLSHTQFENSLYVNTKAFYDKFKNDLDAYSPSVFHSHYRDKGYGGGIEIGGNIGDKDTLKFASSYKFDQHKEHDDGEPVQTYEDKTYSFGLENTYAFSEFTRLILGISYDTRDAVKAQEYGKLTSNQNTLYDFEVGKRHAFNYQAALKHSFDGNDELSLSFAKKTYFPSMKERYSKRFGRNEPNPFLKPEVANHYEIGYARNFGDNLRIESAIFYSKVKDAIGEHNIVINGTTLAQAINVDKADYKGFEFAANYIVTKDLEMGGNYTYLHAKYKNTADTRIYDIPKHKGFVYIDYKILPKFSVYLSQYMTSSLYSNSQSATKLGGFGVTNIKFTYNPLESLSVEAGISNLFDKNYEYREGYPEEGRVFFSNIRYKF